MNAEKHRAGWVDNINGNHYFSHPKSSKITSKQRDLCIQHGRYLNKLFVHSFLRKCKHLAIIRNTNKTDG
jgi:hypothetical protein